MKSLAPLAYALGLIPGVLVVVGNLRGGPWALSATIFFIALCVSDWAVRDSRHANSSLGGITPNLILV